MQDDVTGISQYNDTCVADARLLNLSLPFLRIIMTYSPQEPVSPSPSTPSSGSPPPEDHDLDIQMEPTALATPSNSQGGQLVSPSTITKRRLASGPAHNRDPKTRKKDDGGKRSYAGVSAELVRDGRKDEFVDSDLMEKLKEGE